MARTADTIAIYSRKSRYTGKGESIGNQIDLCREYIRTPDMACSGYIERLFSNSFVTFDTESGTIKVRK